MIHYTLTCDSEHTFEGWFRSSADFDLQAKQGHVSCPLCGSTAVTRGLMAPNVQSGRARDERQEGARVPAPVPAEAPEGPRQMMMVPDPTQRAMLEALRELRQKITENATYVGDKFADEARRMHHGETEARGIYGEATPEEAASLAEEGIVFQPLPILPEDRN